MNNPFDKKDYKIGTEGFLSMYLETFQLILGADLEMYAKSKNETFNKKNPCHIYFILRRPKITIDPESFKADGNKARFDLTIHKKDGYDVINIATEFTKAKSNLELITEYPYNLFTIKDKEKSHMVARPSTMIDSAKVENNIQPEILDYEVLYIGQAFGKNGNRTALNRLFAHETLQKIYTHSLTQNPESDIWIMLTSFAQVSFLISIGSDFVSPETKYKKQEIKLVEHFINNNEFKFSENQKINLTEAALIKYFEPAYNNEFKTNFPNEKHKSYSEYYDLDIRAINIEIDTTEHIRKLFTKKAGNKSYHSAMYEFKNDKDRLSFLGIKNNQ